MRYLFTFFWVSSALAYAIPSRVVFMQETERGKQIMMAEAGQARPITQGTHWHLYPDIDFSGSLITYVEGKNESQLDVMIRDEIRGTVTRLTSGEGRHLHPDLSGDGKWLAFSGAYGNEPAKIMVWRLGQNPAGAPGVTSALHLSDRVVISSEYPCYFPSLSADGSFVVFQRNRGKERKDIVLHRMNTNQDEVLSPEDGLSMAPSLSLDDKFVVYTSNVAGNWDIYVRDLTTGKVNRLTEEASNDFAPAFTPEGSVVYASDKGGRFALYEISKNWNKGELAERLYLQAEGDLYAPAFSALGSVTQQKLSPIPNPARSSFGAARIDDKIYVVGGHQGAEHTYPEESFLTRVDVLDLKNGEWKGASPRPAAAHGYGIAIHGKYLYAFGGFAFSKDHQPKWKSLDLIDRYDTEKDEWKTVARLTRPRSSNVVAKVGDKVYLVGGWDATPKFPKDYDGRFHPEIEVFDLATETVSNLSATLPDPLRRALSGVVQGEEIILVGGISSGAMHFNLIDNVTAFNVRTQKFRELPKLPFATFAPAAGTASGLLWVFGGMYKVNAEEYDYVNDIHFLSPVGWQRSRRNLTEKKGFSQVVELDPKSLAILGGHSYEGGNAPVATVETFKVH